MQDKQFETGVLENRKAGAVFNLWTSFFGSAPKTPTDWTLAVDISHWQGVCNFELMRSKGIRLGITKATDVGWGSKKGFVDDKAVYNYTKMKEAGILRGAYHWLDPFPYTTPEYQANYYLDNFYNKYPTEFPPCLDFEDNGFTSSSDMLWRAQVWLEIVEEKTGRLPVVYTSNGYMSHFDKSKTGWLSKYPLWIAHYIQRDYPTIPYPWKKAIMWQYSSKGHYPYYVWNDSESHGKEFGSGSHSLDMNWFMGSYAELLSFCGGIEPTPEPPSPEPNDVLFRAKFIKRYLYKRQGAGTGYPLVTEGRQWLIHDEVVDVYEEKNGWWRIGEGVWCSGHPSYWQKL